MEANAKKPKAKARPKLNPTENAALKRLEHDLITDDGIVPATKGRHAIHCLTVIGTIEGHTLSPDAQKTTKYEHLLPLLTQVQDNQEIDGLFLLINTVGGDCSCGLAVAEMIASIKKPTVSLVIGDSHSIGVPLSVAADRTFIAPTATMILHPVRLNGTIIGAPQTFEYFRLIQDRIVTFVEAHTGVAKSRLERMMIRQGMMVKDLGTILVGKMAVEEGIIDEVGGVSEALFWLHQEIERSRKKRQEKK